MVIANMSRYFAVDYYKGLILPSSAGTEEKDAILNKIKQRNRLIRDTTFHCDSNSLLLPGEQRFSLWTTYPGLMMGTGYSHDGGLEGEICAGFSFDYVTGLPYLPGSSVKGVLRSAFNHPEYIRELLGNPKAEVYELERALFGERLNEPNQVNPEGKTIFLDAFPVGSNDTVGSPGDLKYRLLELDNITPHHQDKQLGLLTEPNPLTFLKVRPGVKFQFRFLIPDEIAYGRSTITADNVNTLFRQILLDLGAGAKTNVGFGSFTDSQPPQE